MKIESTGFSGVFIEGRGKRAQYYTPNLKPGKKVYGERLVRTDGREFRQWDFNKSKLAAALKKGLKNLSITQGSRVLYLGAATGTTVSHISDIIGTKGIIFAVEFSARVLRKLVFLAEQRKNIIPILEDANHTEALAGLITGVDVLYQDIAQRSQAEIFLKNRLFLRKGALMYLALKPRSIDVSRNPKAIYKEVRKKLEKEVDILEEIELDPFEIDHCMFVCRKR